MHDDEADTTARYTIPNILQVIYTRESKFMMYDRSTVVSGVCEMGSGRKMIPSQ